ncbi:MAG: bifunctional adenosylcobinamide kinase/adenosylcobinamide-phosphate guanylyltransferase [Rubricella sp.]
MNELFPKSSQPLIFLLGGARSGKSALAERIAASTGLPRLFLATAQAFDAEMEARIARHRSDRGEGWTTVEAPLDLRDALEARPAGHVTVVDCLTLWLTNLLLAGREAEADSLLPIPGSGPTIVVSNEVGLGIVPENALARRFRDLQGRLNQRAAAEADTVVFMAAGLPLVLKGALPEGLA